MQELRGALKGAKSAIRHRVGTEGAVTPIEARLVRLLLGSDEARAHARKVVQADDLEAAARVAPIVRTILDLDGRGLPVNGPLVVDALDDEDDRNLLTLLAFRDEAPGGPEEVDGCLESLRSHRMKKQLKDSGRGMVTLQREEETKRLLERMNLGRQLDAPYRDVTH